MRWQIQSLGSTISVALVMVSSLLAQQPLDQQLLDETPPARTTPAVNAAALPPLPKSDSDPAPVLEAAPKPTPDQSLDTNNPLTRIAGKMELVERRLDTGLNTTVVGMQREILSDLDRLLTACQSQCAGSEKEGTPPPDSGKQNQAKQPSNNQTAGKKPGQGPQAPAGSGMGEGNNEPQKLSPRQLMEATWGNLPERERERVFEAAGDSFIPKYARSIRAYFERLAEEDSGN